MSWLFATPALFTRMSTPPIFSRAKRASSATLSSSVTSQRAAWARCPAARSALATSSTCASLRAATITSAPRSASAVATLAPIPRPPPVTTARRPVSGRSQPYGWGAAPAAAVMAIV